MHQRNLMRFGKKKIFFIILAGALGISMFAGCGSSSQPGSGEAENINSSSDGMENSSGAEDTTANTSSDSAGTEELKYSGNIRIWASDQMTDFTKEWISAFQAENPGLKETTFTIEAVEESDMASRMLENADEGADLYLFAQDQLPRLVMSGALEEVPSEYQESLRTDNDAGSVAAATYDEKLYAYPLSSDSGSLLYYDPEVVKNPSDLEAILSDCGAAGRTFCMEITSGWYQPAFFFGTGCDLAYETDADGNFVSANVTYASDAGITALKEMITLAASDSFRNTSSPSEGGEIGAIVDGLWDAQTLKNILGENYACAKLPSFNGEDGDTYQLSGFAGYRLLGVRPQEEEDKLRVCEALADYLSGSEVQIACYQEAGWGPSSLEAREKSEAKEDAALSALYEQMAFNRQKGPYPGDYWTLATSLGDDVITGSLTSSSSDEDLMADLQTFQDTCLSYAGGTIIGD